MSEFPAPPPLQQPGYAPPVSGPSGPRAGFWLRFGSLVIDSLILGVVVIVLALLLKVVGYLIGIVIAIAYVVYLEGSASGQTIGKRAVGIRVIDYRTGGPIGYGRAFIRNLARIVSGLPCYLGYFWMLWDKERQTWHDKIAGDVVVPTSSYPVSNWPN
jgi:uncharacterized RDD family membrane protein YckC